MRTYYKNLKSIGLQYGPLFQHLTKIHKGEFQAVCALTIPDTKSAMPGKFEYPYVIHPATLDCIVQMGIPAATPLAAELSAARVPLSSRAFSSLQVFPRHQDLFCAAFPSRAQPNLLSV